MANPSCPVHPLQFGIPFPGKIQIKKESPPYYEFLVVFLPYSLIPVRLSPSWHYDCSIPQLYIYIPEKYHAAVKTAVLIAFTLSYGGRTKGEISRFYRELYGYESYSHYGGYRSRKEGFLDGIRNIRYAKGIIMIRREDQRRVVAYLRRRGATVSKWEVLPGNKEQKQLKLQVA